MNLSSRQFYHVKSKRSEEFEKGLRKICLRAVEKNEFIFMWLDEKSVLRTLQYVFEENFVIWERDKGFSFGETNRKDALFQATGIHKGIRTLEYKNQKEIFEKGMKNLQEATFPDAFKSYIQELFS